MCKTAGRTIKHELDSKEPLCRSLSVLVAPAPPMFSPDRGSMVFYSNSIYNVHRLSFVHAPYVVPRIEGSNQPIVTNARQYFLFYQLQNACSERGVRCIAVPIKMEILLQFFVNISIQHFFVNT
eukprot:COSAG02_NODE_4286_length_5546_cov_8.070314_2_plen_124_part_00